MLVDYINSNFTINWMAYTIAFALLILLLAYLKFEENLLNTKMLALLGVIVAITIVFRQILHGAGEVSAVFAMFLLSGYIFGFIYGFIVASSTMFLSNFLLGQGPWTIYQMVAAGIVGGGAALLPKTKNQHLNLLILSVYSFPAAFIYGWLTNLWFWSAFVHPKNVNTFLLLAGASFFGDLARALSTVFFLLILGPAFLRILKRYKKRFEVRYEKS